MNGTIAFKVLTRNEFKIFINKWLDLKFSQAFWSIFLKGFNFI